MSEPSKEALEMAEACLDGRELRDGIAAALQKLMDERDMKERVLQHWKLQAGHWQGRAEAAESLHLACMDDAATQRDRLAKLCKDMREWFEKLDPPIRGADKQWFYGFLNNYECQ